MRPNLLFVFPDQWRAQACGYAGQDPVWTPHLDAFAAQSRVLTDCISTFPVCSPYRAMLMTGQFPHRSGVLANCNSSRPGCYLRSQARCLPDVLSEGGYACGYIGKWHLEHPHPPYLPGEPNGRGGKNEVVWDEWTPPARRHGFSFWHSYGAYDAHLRPRYWTTEAARDAWRVFDEWSPRHETDVACEFLRNQNGERDPTRPFALFVSMNPPHPPFGQVPPEYLAPYHAKSAEELLNRPNLAPANDAAGREARQQVKNYFAACTGVDEQFGRLFAVLEESGLDSNTIVVFTSDHGEMMGSHGLMGKPFVYEESLRVPFVVRWPGQIAPGRDDLLLSTPDIMPTLLGLCGLNAQIPPEVQGADLSGAWRGQNGPRPSSALYLTTSPEFPGGGARGIRTHQHTFCVQRTPDGDKMLLFDNQSDPFQQCSLSDAALASELGAELRLWLEKTGDPWLTH